MEQYIPKSALVAEIKKRKGMCDNHYGDYWNGCYNTFTDILSFIDTLEVKEVDIEKIINDYFKDWKFDEELDIMVKPNNYSATFDDIKEIAKHFFELGIKAQKGK